VEHLKEKCTNEQNRAGPRRLDILSSEGSCMLISDLRKNQSDMVSNQG